MEKVGERMADISTEELERIEREYHSGSDNIKPVSYTHLTLPTILRV